MAGELIRTLRVIIAGDAKAAVEAFDKTGKEAEKTEGKLGKLEGRLTKWSAGILAVGVAAGGALAKIGADFDEALDTIRIGTGATGDALAELDQNFKNVLTTVPADMQDVAAAIADVNTRLGLTGEVLEDVSRQFVLLAGLTGDQVSPLVEAGARTLQAWNVAAEEQAGVLDMLWRASQATGIGVSDLSNKLTDSAPVLQSFGFNLAESIALLSGMEHAGLNASQMLAGLKAGLGRIAAEGGDPVRALQDFMTAVQNAGSEAEALQIGVEQFGSRAGPALAKAVRDGKLNFDELTDAIVNGSETIEAATWDTADFAEKLELLKNKALVELSPLADGVFEAINKLVDVLSKAADWAGQNKDVMQALGWVLVSAAGGVLLLTAALKAYHGIVGAIQLATKIWTAAQWLLNIALNANPIGLVVLAIAALIAGITLIVIGLKKLGVDWGAIWDKIKGAAVAVGRWFVDTLWGEWIKGAWDSIVNAGKAVLNWFTELPGKIKDSFLYLVDIITAPFKTAFNAVAGFWNDTVGKVKFNVPDWVPGIGGKSFGFPQIRMLAEGGRMRAGEPAIVGERGWELWIPDTPGTVVPQDKLSLADASILAASASGGAGAASIVVDVDVHVRGNVTAERDLARSIAVEVRDQIERVSRRNGRAQTMTAGRG